MKLLMIRNKNGEELFGYSKDDKPSGSVICVKRKDKTVYFLLNIEKTPYDSLIVKNTKTNTIHGVTFL